MKVKVGNIELNIGIVSNKIAGLIALKLTKNSDKKIAVIDSPQSLEPFLQSMPIKEFPNLERTSLYTKIENAFKCTKILELKKFTK